METSVLFCTVCYHPQGMSVFFHFLKARSWQMLIRLRVYRVWYVMGSGSDMNTANRQPLGRCSLQQWML